MAVKAITNRHAVVKSTVNRGLQRSFRNDTIGNRTSSVVPGKDFSKGFAITLKDIDTAILTHVKNIIKPTVREANEIIKVPVLYGNEERWKAVRKNGVLRDRNNTVILPVMIIKRTDVTFNTDMPVSFDHDQKGKYIQVTRNNKWSDHNRYDRFSVQQGKSPVHESIVTGMPDFVVCTYSILMLTSFIEQMNDLNALWIEHLETYFGDQESYKFHVSLDGGISDATEMPVDGERIIKNELGISVKGYMIPEFTDRVTGRVSEMTKTLTPSKVVFGFEGDATDYQVKK